MPTWGVGDALYLLVAVRVSADDVPGGEVYHHPLGCLRAGHDEVPLWVEAQAVDGLLQATHTMSHNSILMVHTTLGILTFIYMHRWVDFIYYWY